MTSCIIWSNKAYFYDFVIVSKVITYLNSGFLLSQTHIFRKADKMYHYTTAEATFYWCCKSSSVMLLNPWTWYWCVNRLAVKDFINLIINIIPWKAVVFVNTFSQHKHIPAGICFVKQNISKHLIKVNYNVLTLKGHNVRKSVCREVFDQIQ